MDFIDEEYLYEFFNGKSVAIVGSAPSCKRNEPYFIDSHDIVVRVNNYKLSRGSGVETHVHYSFYGNSIKKTQEDLIIDGVKLCMCKCPDGKIMSSPWHAKRMRLFGVDYRYIYGLRKDFWFCDTYIPEMDVFMKKFKLLGKHVPTTGFAAILDILRFDPESVYLTGFDFFASKIHNVDEKWKAGDPSDPVKHMPELELKWLVENVDKYPITLDETLREAINGRTYQKNGVPG